MIIIILLVLNLLIRKAIESRSLKELSEIYDVEFKKLDFCYDKISALSLFKDSSIRQIVIKYLNHDLLSLNEILIKASKLIFSEYGVVLFEVYSASSLAMKIFRTKYCARKII